MDQTSTSRYKFDGVLVAGTKLLVTMGQQLSDQPGILVLNSKMNSCNRQPDIREATANLTPRCSTCCLRTERSEFKRRSGREGPSYHHDNSNCFGKLSAIKYEISFQESHSNKIRAANCSERRPINIELKAKAELKGKLVILGKFRNY